MRLIIADRNRGSETPGKSLESRLDRLLSLLQALSGQKRGEGERNSQSDEYLKSKAVREYVLVRPDKIGVFQRLLETLHALEPIIQDQLQRERQESSTGSSPYEEFYLPPEAPAQDVFGDQNVGYLTLQDGGQSRYLGLTHWACLSEDLGQVNQLLRDQASHMRSGQLMNKSICASNFSSRYAAKVNHESAQQRPGRAEYIHEEGANFHAGGLSIIDSIYFRQAFPEKFSTVDLVDILEGIPIKAQSHVLFRCWYSSVHAVYPLVYIPLILQKYQQFWSWCDIRKPNNVEVPDLDFLPLLFAIWYAGSVSISGNGLRKWFPGKSRSSLSGFFHDSVNRSLIKMSFPKAPSLLSLAAFLLVRTIQGREEDPLLAGLNLGLALRISLTMGLHRDPDLFRLPIWEVEMRRRMWWHIILKDHILALTSGLPILVDDQCFCDTKSISEVKDEKIGTYEASSYELAVAKGHERPAAADYPLQPGPSSIVDVHYITSRAMHKLTSTCMWPLQ